MNSLLFFSSIFAFIFFINIPLSSSFDLYTSCSNNFTCGDVTNVGFPFWGDGRPESCGYPELNLTCSGNVTTIGIMGVTYRVLQINQYDQIIKVVRDDYFDKICSPKFGDTKLNSNLFDYVSGSVDVTLFYDCTSGAQIKEFSCPGGETYGRVAVFPVFPMCKSEVVVRIKEATGFELFSLQNVTDLEERVREGFDVKYKVDSTNCGECVDSKGVCGYDMNLNETVCHCENRNSEFRTCTVTAEALENPVVPPGKGMNYEPD